MKTVKEIFEAQGHKYDKDGRNRTHRSLQALLDSGLVTFAVCESKKVWTNSNGFKFNVRVSLKKPDGMFYCQYFKTKITNIDGYDVLKLIGQTLQKDEVKSFMKSSVDIDSTCHKCNGQGIIPQFHYYCNGICFDCYGLGYNSKHRHTVEVEKSAKKLTGRNFIQSFYVSDSYANFPVGVENIKAINFIGHETAETFLAKKDDMYYIHQPVCKANSWYCIPVNAFEQFKIEYKKVTKIEL